MRKFLLSAALLISPLFGLAQATTGFHRVSQVLTRAQSGVNAQIVPYATISVTNTSTGGTATIYTDPLLSSLITPAVVHADSGGNYSYYLPLNYCVTETITAPGFGTKTIPNVCVNGGGGSAGVSSINTVVGPCTFSGPAVSCVATTCTFSGIQSIAWSLPGYMAASPTTLGASGTQALAFTSQSANYVFAGPGSGGPSLPGFRALVSSDIPNNAANTTGNAATATALAATPTGCSLPQVVTSIAANGNATCSEPSNVTGTATNLSGTPALPNGTTATTQSPGDNTTKIATDAFVEAVAGGVSSINSTTGAFTFTGAGVSCTSTTCTFSGSGSGIGSIAWSMPAFMAASPSTISSSGTQTFSFSNETANYVLAGPSSGSAATPTFRLLASADIPNNAANTSGTAGNLSGTPALPNGTTGTTQSTGDNSTKLATDAYVQANLVANPVSINGTSCALGGSCSPPVPVTVTTSSSATLGGTYNVGLIFNQEATAAQAVVYTLPTPAAGKVFCVKNSYNGSAANTGTLELLVANTGTQYIIFNGALSSSGYVISSGASGDYGCVTGVDTTHWDFTPSVGSWVLH